MTAHPCPMCGGPEHTDYRPTKTRPEETAMPFTATQSAAEALTAVRRLHAKTPVMDSAGVMTNWKTGETTQEVRWRHDCLHCRRPWPCLTAKLLEDVR